MLVECMSNLLANEMFGNGQQSEEAGLQNRLLSEISGLAGQCKHLILVTNEVFADGICYAPETEQYKKRLAQINRSLVELSDEAVEIVYTIPVRIKGRKAEESIYEVGYQ